jgi:hypothetical protein
MKKKRMNDDDNGYDDDDESTSSTDGFLSEPKEVSSGEEMNLPADSDEKLLIRWARSDDGDTFNSEHNDSIGKDEETSNDGSDNDGSDDED